ncbi:hypothetical protein ACA910_008372 [Epithemia clementina (nom. ined.)]
MVNDTIKASAKNGNIATALNFGITANNTGPLRSFYKDWAKTYDADVMSEKYLAPIGISCFFEQVRKHIDHHTLPADCSILDAGCGTGLVGPQLQKLGYTTIDGFDLSQEMVEIAERTKSYRHLQGNVDMNKTNSDLYKDNEYGAILACGVFTMGHVPPESIRELIRVTKPKGLVVVTTRQSYYESTNFQQVLEELEQAGEAKLIQKVLSAPYTEHEQAHYWALQVN